MDPKRPFKVRSDSAEAGPVSPPMQPPVSGEITRNSGRAQSGTRALGALVTGVLRVTGRLSLRAKLTVTAVVFAGLAVLLLIEPGAPWSQKLGDLAITIATYMATAACVCAARRRDAAFRAWAVLAAACGLYAAAQTYYAGYGLLHDHVYPFPSVADVGFIGFTVLAGAGLLLFPERSERAVSRLRVVVSGMLIAVAVLFISWATVLGPLVRSGGSGFPRLLGLAYPTADIALASLVIATGLYAGAAARKRSLLLGAGLLTLAVTHSVYISLTLAGQTGTTGTILALGWAGCFMLIALATQARAQSSGTRRHFTVTQELLPYVPVTGAVVVSASLDVTNHPRLLGVGILLLGLILLHQAVVAFEKVALANNLEQAVAARTKELASLAARNELLLNSAGDGIYGVDRRGRITFANPAACEMLGYRSDELMQEDAHTLFHKTPDGTECHPAEICPLVMAMAIGSPQRGADGTYLRRDRSLFPVDKVVTPIEEGGRITGAVVSFRDITKRREVERMKDEFTSIVSHELRTPLTSIRGSLGLLAGGALGPMPEKGQRMLEIAVANTDRLVRLVNDILDIERIDSGLIVMERQHVPAAELMIRAHEAMEATALSAQVTVRLSTVDTDLWADPDRIMQTLTNLLSNAIKFSAPDGTVELRAQRSGGEVLFSVADNGRGIPADRLGAIFERFQQVDSSDAREKGGTGLGLPICRSIVEQHGGRIWVESTLGKGSTFFFTVPAAPTSGTGGTAPKDAPAVLVCDDDAGVRDALCAFLERGGYRGIAAASGEEALTLASTHRPVALLLDLLMPGLSGWETAKRLKGRPETEHIPIVVCSVLSAQDTVPPAETKVAGWIDKPVNEKSMLQALEGALFMRDGRSRVLVVEDDADLAGILTTMFQRHGLETFTAATGTEALRISQQVLPDLLVLDVRLAESDGFAVIDWLRRHERLHKTPVVVYTAQDLDESQRDQLRLGETHFFTKGRISPDDFEERVMALLTRMTAEEVSAIAR